MQNFRPNKHNFVPLAKPILKGHGPVAKKGNAPKPTLPDSIFLSDALKQLLKLALTENEIISIFKTERILCYFDLNSNSNGRAEESIIVTVPGDYWIRRDLLDFERISSIHENPFINEINNELDELEIFISSASNAAPMFHYLRVFNKTDLKDRTDHIREILSRIRARNNEFLKVRESKNDDDYEDVDEIEINFRLYVSKRKFDYACPAFEYEKKRRGRNPKLADREFWMQLFQLVTEDPENVRKDKTIQNLIDWVSREPTLDKSYYTPSFIQTRVNEAWRASGIYMKIRTKQEIKK